MAVVNAEKEAKKMLGDPEYRRIPKSQRKAELFQGARHDVFDYKMCHVDDETSQDGCWRTVTEGDANHPDVPKKLFTPFNGRKVLKRQDTVIMYTEWINSKEERDENMAHVGEQVKRIGEQFQTGKGDTVGVSVSVPQQIVGENAPKV